jgi:hypothetical protein
MTSVFGASCDRTRALLSRQLDTQLPELERRAVALHTERCAACRSFERDALWITEELRAAPLEPLRRPVAVMVPRRPFPTRVVANIASAAALLVVAVGGVTLASQPPEGGSAQVLGQASTLDLRFGDPGLREIRREALLAGELQVLPKSDWPSHGKPALPATGG